MIPNPWNITKYLKPNHKRLSEILDRLVKAKKENERELNEKQSPPTAKRLARKKAL